LVTNAAISLCDKTPALGVGVFSLTFRRGNILNNRLFVRDFSPQTDASHLESLFSNVGNVRSVTLQEQVTKSGSRRVAYIEMSSPEDARDCISRFHAMKIDGHILTVTEDQPHIPDPDFRAKRMAAQAASKRAAVPPKKKGVVSDPVAQPLVQ
jgi:RNA recognition motif-containing protein